MANRTVKDAHTVHGTNPQYLVEKIIRSRIYESKYWKEECFAVTAELIVDKGMELRYCGGVYGGNIKPTPFMCLLLKMLQIQPEKDIVIEFLRQEDFKYIRALAAIYLRLTATALDIYKYLEPLYNDYRKLRFQNREGTFVLSTMDQFVDELLTEERACDIILPRLQKRHVLEESSSLEQRVSLLDDDNEDDDEEGEDDDAMAEDPSVTAIEMEMQKIASRRQQRDRDRGDTNYDNGGPSAGGASGGASGGGGGGVADHERRERRRDRHNHHHDGGSDRNERSDRDARRQSGGVAPPPRDHHRGGGGGGGSGAGGERRASKRSRSRSRDRDENNHHQQYHHQQQQQQQQQRSRKDNRSGGQHRGADWDRDRRERNHDRDRDRHDRDSRREREQRERERERERYERESKYARRRSRSRSPDRYYRRR